ncbi:MAG: hypothetical protein JJ964_11385 [Rhizobiales bacterium]|nr:hypothetical protein [Hyphomicrobiales bacterium]
MGTDETASKKSSVRQRADEIKPYICKNIVAVIENPTDIKNIGTVIRNVNALGVEKTYIIDTRKSLPDDWQDMRERRSLSKTSVSAIKWSFVKRFDSTEDCIEHLNKNRFVSLVTSPHVKGKRNEILHEVDYTQYTKLAVWFGMIESLNLGTTSGIVLYEVTKQRRDYQSKFKRANKRREIKS